MLVSREILQRYDLKGPRIILGDFNEWTRGLTSRLLAGHLESAELQKAFTEVTNVSRSASFSSLGSHVFRQNFGSGAVDSSQESHRAGRF